MIPNFSLGDKLIVGLNSDASVTRIKRTPFNNQKWRKEFLEGFSCVDDVIIFEEDTPWNLIKDIRPHILVKGWDYRPKDVLIERQLVNRIVIYNTGLDIRTTKIMNCNNNSRMSPVLT